MAANKNITLGAVFDFMLYCLGRENPIIVGADYPEDRFFETFKEWAAERGLAPADISIQDFREACKQGSIV